MLKKFNVFALALLIIGQTILGPIGTSVAFADEQDPDAITTTTAEENNEIDPEADLDGQGNEQESEELNPIETPGVTPDHNGEGSTEDNVDKPGQNSGESSDSNSDLDESAGMVTMDEDEGEEISALADQDIPENVDIQNDVTMTFNKLVVNGTDIKSEADALNVYPEIGDEIGIYFDFSIVPGQNAGPGSSFKFDLPPVLLEFDANQLSGVFDDGDVKIQYTTTNKVVTVKVVEGALIEGLEPFIGTFQFRAKFNADGAKEGLEQELEIPILGEESLKFPFTFKPENTGQSMSKKGISSIEGNDRIITWEVWTNREGEKLSQATLNDKLGNGHELSSDITVDQYVVGLTGVNSTAKKTTTTTQFPVNLDDGRYAYKLTYKTKVTRAQQNVTETFTNKAILTNNGNETNEASASATHTYGTKLEKTAKNFNVNTGKYRTTWQVKYNYFGSVFESNTLTDTITGNHKIDEDTIKVYHVNVDASGQGTVGALVDPQPNPKLINNSQTLEIDLKSPNGEAYFIEYDSVLTDGFVDDSNGGRIANNIVDKHENKSNQGFDYSQSIFNKSLSAIDYDNKEITWKITVNAEKGMNNFKIEDTFVLDSKGESRQSLIQDTDGKYYVDVSGTKTEVAVTDAKKGFDLSLGDVPKGDSYTITYKTKFDIQTNGTPYPEYKNIGKGTWKNPDLNDTKEYSVERTAQYNPKSTPTGNNGYKNGSFDHKEQVFNWKLAANINKQQINGATLVDDIKPGHQLVPDSIEVYKLDLAGGNDTGTFDKDNPVTSGFVISSQSEQGFTITFNAPTTDAYIVTYQTKDSDDIIGNEGTNLYENEALFTTIDDTEFILSASTTVKHANEIIDKKVQTNPKDETITWTVDVNKSHSALGEGIELRDTISENQLLLADTFKIRDIEMDAEGNVSYTNEREIEPTESTDNWFKLVLDNLDQKGYQIEYKTFFLGADGENFSNEASITYEGETIGVENDSKVENEKFNYNASSGTISSEKGNLSIVKLGVDPITGETLSLDDIKFELWNITGTVKLKEGTTENGGKLSFEGIRYGTYLLKESDTPNDYLPIPAEGLPVVMGEDNDFLVNGGNDFIIENLKDVDLSNACTEFTLTVKDVDGNPVTTKEISLTSKVTGETKKVTTNADGVVKLPFQGNVSAGGYTVTVEDGETTVELGDVEVNYDGNCEAEVQPTPSCPMFTVTVKGEKDADGNDTFRENVELTLKYEDNTVADITVTTDGNGQFKLPSDSTKAGKYTVYEGQQYLGIITVTYKGGCEDELVQAPKCEVFTLTVKDVDGEPREEGTEVTIKVKGDENDTGVTKTTNADGKVELNDLEPNEYEVYENNTLIGNFSTTTDCEASVQPDRTLSCPIFTVTINNESGDARPNVIVTVKDKFGNDVATSKTDEHGKIEVQSGDLPAGKYDVYEGGIFLGEITVSYIDETCEAVLDTTVENAGFCPLFTLTVNDRSNNPREDVTIVVKDAEGHAVEGVDANGDPITTFETNEDGQVTFQHVIKPGTYTVYEVDANGDEKRINSFTVTTDCEAEVKPSTGGGGGGTPPAPSCDVFTVTVKQNGTNVGANVELTLKSGTTEVKRTTDASGKIIIDKPDLSEGTYTAYDKDGKEVGTIVVSYDEEKCQDEIDLLVKSCETFTITVKESGEVVDAGTSLTLKDASGNTVGTGTTNADGKIVFNKDDLPKGTYTAVDKDGKEIVNITVSYDEGKCQAVVDILLKACEHYKLTVVDTPNTFVEVKDKDGNTIVTGTTDANGNVTFTQSIPEGNYEVYIDGEKVGDLSVTDSCEGTITPEVEIGPDKPEPEKPGDGEDDSNGDNGESNGGGDNTDNGNNDTNPPAGNGNGTDTGSKTPTGDGNNGNVNSTDTNGNKSDSGSKTDKLPQTGEEHYMYMIALGTLLLAAGASVLYRQRRKA